ncbi:hypothetical protein JNUCC1_01269 [Lentibacillus sp. JNUCC-1]|nr:hypothetical protein [Lentibacillus sp. JNUCC-1]
MFNEEVLLEDLIDKVREGYVFRQTTITQQYSYKQYIAERHEETVLLYLIKPSGQIKFYSEEMRTVPGVGDVIVSFTPRHKEQKKIQVRLENQRNGNGNGTFKKKD